MLGMLAGVCALMLSPPNIDGEEAVARARQLLVDLRVPRTMELATLARSKATGTDLWWIGFRVKDARLNVELAANGGRVLRIQTSHNSTMPATGNTPPTRDGTRRLWAALRRLGYAHDVTVDFLGGFTHGPTSASFYLLADGRRFFNVRPEYCHRLTLSPQNGMIDSFLPSPAVPPVNGSSPRVSAAAATRKIMAWVRRRAKETGRPLIESPADRRVAELGYWKFAAETRARLVWRLARYSTIRGARYGGGCYRPMVDALSGKVLDVDDRYWSSEF